jgi:glycerophosphoryl diester phosphodiesterase
MRAWRMAAGLAIGLSACATGESDLPQGSWPAPTLDGARPLVIAHRGASGLMPEHTLEAYQLAIEQGADCIEPDLVMTKDGVLIARHDTYLSTTTDVADRPEFAARKRSSPDPEFAGREDWWVADFTLAEIKTLRARQLFERRSKAHDGQFQIPTFDEVLALAARAKSPDERPVCVYPEAKSPAYHAKQGLDLLDPILSALKARGFDRPDAPVFIQSFEPDFVRRAAAATELPVALLAGSRADYDAALALPGAPFWDGAGLNTSLLFSTPGVSSGVVEAAHQARIPVHVWTYRDDAPPTGYQNVEAALRDALKIGIDGFFTDFPATGVRVRAAFSEAAG